MNTYPVRRRTFQMTEVPTNHEPVWALLQSSLAKKYSYSPERPKPTQAGSSIDFPTTTCSFEELLQTLEETYTPASKYSIGRPEHLLSDFVQYQLFNHEQTYVLQAVETPQEYHILLRTQAAQS